MVVGTHVKDFREQNPGIVASIKQFAEIYTYNSPDEASKILWSAYFVAIIANDKNPYRNFLSDDERRQKIVEEYYPRYTSKFVELERCFKTVVLSKEHTLYNIHLRKYEEFVAEMDNLVLSSEDGWKKYLDATSKLEKISKFYDDLAKKYSESINKSSAKEGGGSYTAAERRNMK
jgi:hypothetical protein